MSGRRSTWGQALKEAAIKFAREAERFVGANDAAPCNGCAHQRSEHCGCGMACFSKTSDGLHSCECEGFVPKPEPEKAG